jgi:hypothetical protein
MAWRKTPTERVSYVISGKMTMLARGMTPFFREDNTAATLLAWKVKVRVAFLILITNLACFAPSRRLTAGRVGTQWVGVWKNTKLEQAAIRTAPQIKATVASSRQRFPNIRILR